MSSHNTEAAYASAEIANIIQTRQHQFFNGLGISGEWSLFAGREGGSRWPLADGVISATNPQKQINIAFEFKRNNEGLHGILTALGQSFAYLEKGYDASIMAFPSRYSSHLSPGEHIDRIIQSTSPDIPIWIFTYDDPDLSSTRPFFNRLICIRDIPLGNCRSIQHTEANNHLSRVQTLWAHVREGMSHPDAFFRYCQSAKLVSALGENLDENIFPQALKDAVNRISPDTNIFYYLSYTSSDNKLDKTWRKTWFTYYFWRDLIPIFNSASPYSVNETPTRIRIEDNIFQKLFSGRSDSLKAKLVNRLNSGEMTEDQAWEEYAKHVRKNAHSYREVIDSGLDHIGFISNDGDLTELGYKYVNACERTNSAYTSVPMEILRGAVLINGQFAALLHYIFKLSEEKFDSDLYAFTRRGTNPIHVFDRNEYRNWLVNYFANTLHILQQSSLRAGGTRHPLQAEISFMNKLGLIRSDKNGHPAYRVGTGLCIDWPQIENSLQYFSII